MSTYEVADEMLIPRHLPGQSPLEAVPEVRVKITIEVEGGGLPEGETVTIAINSLTLRKSGQLAFRVLEEDQDRIEYGMDMLPPEPRRQISLNLEAAPPSDLGEPLYTITYPGGEEVG